MRAWLRSALVGLVLLPIRAYQYLVSPWLPPSCRFSPTCSAYAEEAVRRHGPWRGTGLALWRICRCHPLARGGHDPVPEPASRPKPKNSRPH